MVFTGLLLFYAVPVRSTQSVWFRAKMILLLGCAINAFLFHKRMNESVSSWDNDARAPGRIRLGAALSLGFWSLVVICGRFIAYDWFDCEYTDVGSLSQMLSGCIDGQIRY